MTSFTALDQVLNAGAITPATSRAVAAPADFQPLFAKALVKQESEIAAPAEAACDPQIELVKEDGHVRQIIVTCRCGERTVLDCAY